MGRSPCCDKNGLKKGPWTPEEDEKLIRYIQIHGPGNWRTLPKNAGLQRCGKSCRLRWTNYLRPDIKRGRFSFEEEETIIQLHSILGNKWSAIAARLPGRTDNEIKNYWNTHIRKRLLRMGIDPVTHSPRLDLVEYLSSAMGSPSSQLNNLSNLLGLQAILNPELLTLLGSLTPPQNQLSPETQLPNLIEQTQFQIPISTADQFNICSSLPTQIQTQLKANSNQYLSQGFEGSVMGQARFENWMNNSQSFGFDSMPLNSSSNASALVKSSNSSEDDSLKFEIPAGCVDINDFL